MTTSDISDHVITIFCPFEANTGIDRDAHTLDSELIGSKKRIKLGEIYQLSPGFVFIVECK